jgi:hypothetical protein
MDADALWKRFLETGKVEDYLKYKTLVSND